MVQFELILISGHMLKQKVMAKLTDSEISRIASKYGHKIKLPNEDVRPNMFKARDLATDELFKNCSKSDPWLKDIINQWVSISRLPENDADFWNHPRFMQGIKNGHGLRISKYLDDDENAWISVSDSPTTWVHKKKLNESTRLKMIEAKKRKK